MIEIIACISQSPLARGRVVPVGSHLPAPPLRQRSGEPAVTPRTRSLSARVRGSPPAPRGARGGLRLSCLPPRLTSSSRPCLATSEPVSARSGKLLSLRQRGKASPLASGFEWSAVQSAQTALCVGRDVSRRPRDSRCLRAAELSVRTTAGTVEVC
ncbi:hypothetical protein NDU88_002485 [Pleurodeles waltl]|uniref:Uncharacterized protein n=1 Tax=Pleurodeles waltl TaxID=8319 RepID=A0AAV7UVR5_PLEWA|nr:hypothetical protein NDU88_002485 [Pleurodeles waltl]